ncbi:MAG: class I SAM-dependent methyltransferase [Anaerolineae bacterium]
MSQHWDKHVEEVENHTLKGWLDWEFIEEHYIRPQVSGDPQVYYLHYFLQKHIPKRPVARALSIGCGGGNLERALIQLGAAQEIDAMDISPESIRLAKELAAQEGMESRLHYEVSDINKAEFPEKTYDFVIAKMSLHHISQLEHVYHQIRRTLKDGGVFVFNEFIGPSRFQWTDLQLTLMEQILSVVPEKNTYSSVAKNHIKRIDRPTVLQMLAMDPSEAVRSAEIMPRLTDEFEILENKPYGGTLLHMLLTHTMGSYDLENPDQQALLKMLFLFERTLIQQNVLQPDFAYVVARPKHESELNSPPTKRKFWQGFLRQR